MKLYRFESAGRARLGVGINGMIHDAEALFNKAGEKTPDVVLSADLRTICAAPDTVVVFLEDFLQKTPPEIKANGVSVFNPALVRILPPIPNPKKFICIGLNYRDHCEEQHKEPPKQPMLFSKFANAVRGHGDKIIKRPVTNQLDFEGELGVVIGQGGSHITRADALKHVFGYTVVHDVSARDLQKSDGQWLRAKGQDSYGPMGPCITTTSEIPDPQNLTLRTTLNGQIMQDSNTGKMIFSVVELIAFITESITLEPGDIISTGTPSGVGVHRNPPIFLQDGDVVEIEIERIGLLRNTIRNEGE